MTILQKINEINEYCGYSLGFQYHSIGWQISSFEKNSLFEYGGKLYKSIDGYLTDKSFDKLIDRAYQIYLDEIERKK